MTPFDALLWDFSEPERQFPTLSGAVELAEGSTGASVQIAVETIIVDGSAPFDVIRPQQCAHERRRSGIVTLMRVHDDHGPFVLGAWPTRHDHVFHIIGSIPATDSRWQKVERWIGAGAPRVIPCFLNNDDFADLGTSLSEFGDVEVSRLTARRRRDHSSLSRGWQARNGSLRPTHHDAIAETERDGASVRSLTLQVGHALNVHLRRLAGATYYTGSFEIFEAVVLSRLAQAAADRRFLLDGRVRMLDRPLTQPISIRLPGAVLTDAESTGDVISLLERQSSTSVAVLHRNPYLHVVVTDYLDGSNFDVFVTAADAIQVYPGFRASLGAWSRLTQRLSEGFEAIEIGETPPRPTVTLDDLVAQN